ncbi:hypothetical protein EV675_3255 [Pigmentiphaga kullae]|uniref:Uncharacterized protein n=1 Tax=Pigmentiphaga kullae TaxID=151784 RepID=A0A4Q7NCJ8_9BURK|nr:hypothetical protein EV675_3255 [Pigmentiphaga kullae]
MIELLAAYPGREFRMGDLVRHVSKGRTLAPSERQAARMAVLRVLGALVNSGQVERVGVSATSCYYVWCSSLLHGVDENCYANCHNTPGNLRP